MFRTAYVVVLPWCFNFFVCVPIFSFFLCSDILDCEQRHWLIYSSSCPCGEGSCRFKEEAVYTYEWKQEITD